MLKEIITKGIVLIVIIAVLIWTCITVVDASYQDLTAGFNDYKTEQSQEYNSLQARLDATEENLAETQ